MILPPFLKRQCTTQCLLRNTAAVLLVAMIPSIAMASSWSPTLLVNTEAFQTIDQGDGSTDIELRFGNTGSGLKLNVTSGQFEFDTGVEIQGTASGREVHAQDALTSSGGLTVEGNTVLNGYLDVFNQAKFHGTASGNTIHAERDLTSSGTLTVEDDAVFGSGIVLNGVKYIFPFGDASASGKILASDGAGNLTWTAAGSTPNVFQTISVSGQSDIVSDQESDTLTFVAGSNVTITTNAGSDTITIAATDTSQATTFTLAGDGGSSQTISHGNTLTVAGGSSITTTAGATDTVTVDITDNSVNFTELADALSLDTSTTLTLGSSNFDIIGTSTGEFRIFGTASGTRIHADTALTSSGTLSVDGAITFRSLTSCTALETDSSGNLTCGTDADTHFSGTGSLQNFFDNRYVNTSGDTMTGALIINDASPDAKGMLQVIGTASGRIFHAQDELTASGTLVVEGASTFNGTATFSSLTSCTLLTTDSNGQLTCDSEGFNESVDDRVNSLLQAGSGITLSYDDANNKLTINQDYSSGAVLSLTPEYAGAVYSGSGASNNVGQLVLAYDSTNAETYYNWSSTQSSLQSYNIVLRVKVPDEFDHWDDSAPITFRYRTNAASSADNQIDVIVRDTSDAVVATSGNTNLANTSWTTATITGPESGGTFTAGSYFTVVISMQARTTNSGQAHAGYINFNWATRPN